MNSLDYVVVTGALGPPMFWCRGGGWSTKLADAKRYPTWRAANLAVYGIQRGPYSTARAQAKYCQLCDLSTEEKNASSV